MFCYVFMVYVFDDLCYFDEKFLSWFRLILYFYLEIEVIDFVFVFFVIIVCEYFFRCVGDFIFLYFECLRDFLV